MRHLKNRGGAHAIDSDRENSTLKRIASRIECVNLEDQARDRVPIAETHDLLITYCPRRPLSSGRMTRPHIAAVLHGPEIPMRREARLTCQCPQ